MNSPLKVGVVGMGGIGYTHCNCYKNDSLAELVAVCDIIKAKADKAAEDFGCKAYYSVKDMLKAHPELDIVDVDPGSLPILHIDLVFRAEEEDTEIEDEDDEARGEGCPCCSHQSEFRRSEITIDEHPVEEDVPGIGNEDDGHIDDGVVDAVGHLTECRREEEEWHRAYLDDEIRAHEWQELIGLSHVGEHEIEPYEQGHDDHALK